MEEKFLTVSEVAKSLRVTRQAVYRWLEDGDLRGYKFGRVVRIPQSDFDRFLAESEIQPGQQKTGADSAGGEPEEDRLTPALAVA
jgi:excisionase family DNA binding protein